jgi:hypothetical protein
MGAIIAGVIAAVPVLALMYFLSRQRALDFLAVQIAAIVAVYIGSSLTDGRASAVAPEIIGAIAFFSFSLFGRWVSPAILATGYFAHRSPSRPFAHGWSPWCFDPAEAEDRIEAWRSTGKTTPDDGWSRAELEEHVRDEHSTYTWLLEPMIQRSGFAIEDAEFSDDGIFVKYVLRRTTVAP